MILFPEINILKNLDYDKLNQIRSIFNELTELFSIYLGLKPLYFFEKVQIKVEEFVSKNNSVFEYGLKELRLNDCLSIIIDSKSKKFLPFIIFREILRCFVPEELRNNDSVNLIINQITILICSDFEAKDEWRFFVRKKLEQKSPNLLTDFDRIESFFEFQEIIAPNPIQYFFNYVINKKDLLKDFGQSFSYILFKEFEEKFFKPMVNNDLIETIRVIIKIFYKIKFYKNLLDYQNYFKDFRQNGELKTGLSQRVFIEKMNWIKSSSFISPSYHINWNAINKSFITLRISFNPKLRNEEINQILIDFPFIISPKTSFQSFSPDIFMYLVPPITYIDDLREFLRKLKKNNYISRYLILSRISLEHFINLNYFKEDFSNSVLINPRNKNYDKDLQISFELIPERNFFNPNLTFLDFLILDRIRWFSVHGIGFESRAENLKLLKSDLLNEIYHQKKIINKLKDILKNIYTSDKLKKDLESFLTEFEDQGFFYLIKKLEIMIQAIKIIEDIVKFEKITDIKSLNSYLATNSYSQSIETNLLLKKNFTNKSKIYDLISIFFNSEIEFNQKLELYELCYDLLKNCHYLKIYNVNTIRRIINEKNTSRILFHSKEKKLQEIYNEYKVQDITSNLMNSTIQKLIELDPPIIFPLLINTIITKKFEKDYLQLIFKKSQKSEKLLSEIKIYFPRVIIHYSIDLISERDYYYVEISTPALKSKELMIFSSILYNLFKDDLIYLKNHIWSGFITRFSTKDFYDFEKKEFFYTKDLFTQYLAYVESLLKNNYKSISHKKFRGFNLFWLKLVNLSELVKIVNKRRSKEHIFFDLEVLSKLHWFILNLKELILNTEQFTGLKSQLFFKNFIKSINFIPAFHKYNLFQFMSYCVFNDMNQVDFTSNIIPNFLKIEYPACIENTIPILILYLMPQKRLDHSFLKPFDTPDDNIREYCGFFIKDTMFLSHFQLNITLEGWDYDSSIFKEHLQNVLFNKNYQFDTTNHIICPFKDVENKSLFKLDSPEYRDLCEIFDFHSIDIKSYIGTKKAKTVDRIQNLMKKNLIFPYVKVKNLDFQEKVYLIIPNLNYGSMDTLIKIFGWFNYGFIHKIEGKYFIQGFKAPIDFEYGLMMEIYFPKCELAEFKQLFDMVFEYLDIEHYLILKDFVNGETLVKNVYEDPNFFDNYHPLRNVKYDGKDDNK